MNQVHLVAELTATSLVSTASSDVCGPRIELIVDTYLPNDLILTEDGVSHQIYFKYTFASCRVPIRLLENIMTMFRTLKVI